MTSPRRLAIKRRRLATKRWGELLVLCAKLAESSETLGRAWQDLSAAGQRMVQEIRKNLEAKDREAASGGPGEPEVPMR